MDLNLPPSDIINTSPYLRDLAKFPKAEKR